MTSDELNKTMKQGKISPGIFSNRNMFFDTDYSIVLRKNLVAANDYANSKLGWYQYSPRADCNRFHAMKLGRMLEWILKNTGNENPDILGRVYGYYDSQNHVWGYSHDENGLVHINYWDLVDHPNIDGKGSVAL